ncbi:MAG: phage portal protein [Pseudomonadota bacterium]
MWDSFGGSDLYDRVRPGSNVDGDGTRWAPPSMPSDRRHGANWPLWRTHQELDWLRQESRLRAASNSYCKGLLRNLTNNVVGKGFTYKCQPILAEGAQATPEQEQLAREAQAIADHFLRQNNWNASINPQGNLTVSGSRERESFRRVQRDGEAFLRFFGQDNGTTLVRFVEPEQIRDQGGALQQDGWSFGSRHQMEPTEDVETILEYSVFWPDPSAKGGEGDSAQDKGMYELVPADEVMHLKGPDTDSNIKRGTPAFVYDTGAALDRAAKVQRNASMGAALRAATGEIWQHQTATLAGVSNLAAGLASFQRTDPTTGKSENYERIQPGAIRRIPAGQELVAPPPDQSESFLTAGQGDLRMAAAAHCAPEFWMAETSSGNYSNLESAAAPAVRDGQCEQEYYKAAFARCIWKALEWAAECGNLPKDIATRIEIEAEAPAVLHRNELEKAQEDQILIGLGVKDRETACAERGLDWKTVSANNQEYQQQQGPEGPGLGLPGEGDDQGQGGAPQPPGTTMGRDSLGRRHRIRSPGGGEGGGAGKPAPFRPRLVGG